MVPTMAALTAFFVMALMMNALNQPWLLIFLYVGGGIPMNAWLMKGYFDTVPISLDESAKLMELDTSVASGKSSFLLFVHWLPFKHLGFHGAFRDYILSKFLLRDEVNLR